MWSRKETTGVWQVLREQGQVVQVERVKPHTLTELERKRALAAQREEQTLETPAVMSFTAYLVRSITSLFF